jgi:hypothetical protein
MEYLKLFSLQLDNLKYSRLVENNFDNLKRFSFYFKCYDHLETQTCFAGSVTEYVVLQSTYEFVVPSKLFELIVRYWHH